jgi:hypothetical protein
MPTRQVQMNEPSGFPKGALRHAQRPWGSAPQIGEIPLIGEARSSTPPAAISATARGILTPAVGRPRGAAPTCHSQRRHALPFDAAQP